MTPGAASEGMLGPVTFLFSPLLWACYFDAATSISLLFSASCDDAPCYLQGAQVTKPLSEVVIA
jgi:hypothetical protein